MHNKVVSLGLVRDMLAEWEKVRLHIVAGDIGGFYTVFQSLRDQRETVYHGGVYKADSETATRATLKLSMARALAEDEPPLFQASQM